MFSEYPKRIKLIILICCCLGKSCPAIESPEHGSVLIPCVREYGLTCMKRCSKGFFLDGKQSARCVMQGNQTAWTGTEAICKGKWVLCFTQLNHTVFLFRF